MYGYPHALRFGSTDITQLTDISPNTNIGHYTDTPAGQVAPFFLGSQSQMPDVTFRTKQLSSVLGLTSSGTLYTCADLSGGNVDFFYKAATSMGVRDADNSTTHLRGRLQANAFLAWTEISASENGSAELSGIVKPIYNGSNLPMVFTSGVALSGTSAATEQYGLGPVKINGTALNQVVSVNYATNPVYDDITSAGLGMNVFTALESINPVVRIVTRDLNTLATYGFGLATSGNGLEVFFRARAASGLNIADATTSHIKLAATAGKISVNGASGMRGAVEIVVQLAKATVVFTPSIGVAIS